MIFYGKIKEGKLVLNNPARYDKFMDSFGEGASVMLEVQKEVKLRSDKQRRAMELWFDMVAKALNKDGFDMRVFIDQGVDIMWTPYTVKEYLWRPMQQAILGKTTTRALTTDEIDKIYEPINKVMGERTGIHIPFPSIEEQFKEN